MMQYNGPWDLISLSLSLISEQNSTLVVYRESKNIHSDLSESLRHKFLFPTGLPLFSKLPYYSLSYFITPPNTFFYSLKTFFYFK